MQPARRATFIGWHHPQVLRAFGYQHRGMSAKVGGWVAVCHAHTGACVGGIEGAFTQGQSSYRLASAISQQRISRNRRLTAPVRVRRSQNFQIVFASGTRSPRPSPRNRMNNSRSLIRNSARSSLRPCCAWITRILTLAPCRAADGHPGCRPNGPAPSPGPAGTVRSPPPPHTPQAASPPTLRHRRHSSTSTSPVACHRCLPHARPRIESQTD